MDPQLLERLRAFHGHLGPFALLGYRAGQLALSTLQAPSHFGIRARVLCPPHPPQSCFADGVQCGTGCTLGKGNIVLEPAEEIALTVTVLASGAEVTVRPRREICERFPEWLKECGDEGATHRLLQMSDEQLFYPCA